MSAENPPASGSDRKVRWLVIAAVTSFTCACLLDPPLPVALAAVAGFLATVAACVTAIRH